MTPLEKALLLSYIHSQLLTENLDLVAHEAKVNNSPEFGKLNDKLMKLRAASKNAFRVLNKNLEEHGILDGLRDRIEDLIDKTWEDPV